MVTDQAAIGADGSPAAFADPVMTVRGPCSRRGFSLLEVILATAILSAAAMVLYSTFSLGERQGREASQILEAQLLCQSTLDELLAEPTRIKATELTPFDAYPHWAYVIQWAPTELENVIVLTVQVTPNTQLTPGGADPTERDPTRSSGLTDGQLTRPASNSSQVGEDDMTSAAERTAVTGNATGQRPDPRSFTLVRWVNVAASSLVQGADNFGPENDLTPLGSRAPFATEADEAGDFEETLPGPASQPGDSANGGDP